MATYQTKSVFTELSAITEANIKTIKEVLQPLSSAALQQKPAPNKWSIVECIEHLNAYGRFYLPAIQKAMEKGAKRNFSKTETYDSGWFGEYFANLMRLNAQGQPPSKMPAMKAYNPSTYTFNAENVLNEFLAQQLFLKQLLFNAEAQNASLGKIRVPISITRFLKLKLGDTLRFVIYHNERHVQQALRNVAKGR